MKVHLGRLAIVALILCLAMSGCILLFSCNTSKKAFKEKIIYDSTAIRELKLLKAIHSHEKQQYEKIIEELNTTGVYFDTVYLPGDTAYLPGKVIIDKDGTIQAEGRLKSVLIRNQRLVTENMLLQKKVDSLMSKEKKDSTVVTHVKVKTVKETKNKFPVWLIIACIVIGMMAENKLKLFSRIKKLIQKLKLIP